MLRRLGILACDAPLADRVDRQAPLPAVSRMEVEIRAATVWAGELILQSLRPQAPVPSGGLIPAHKRQSDKPCLWLPSGEHPSDRDR